MKTRARSVEAHYGQADLSARILAACEAAGKDLDALTRDDLAVFDEFHVGGRAATRALAHLAALPPGRRVLDLGCGLGGPARTLADEFGCSVVGLDLVEDYCRAAAMLTDRVGLGDRVRFLQGDATALPFADESFDVVWTQHVIMNVADKARLFGEARRVLRPGGRLALYEVCAGTASPPCFPVPWAAEPSISFLVSPEALRRTLDAAGFAAAAWQDVTAAPPAWLRKAIQTAQSQDAPPPLGLHLLMGATAAEKIRNLVRNLKEDRIRLIQGVLDVAP